MRRWISISVLVAGKERMCGSKNVLLSRLEFDAAIKALLFICPFHHSHHLSTIMMSVFVLTSPSRGVAGPPASVLDDVFDYCSSDSPEPAFDSSAPVVIIAAPTSSFVRPKLSTKAVRDLPALLAQAKAKSHATITATTPNLDPLSSCPASNETSSETPIGLGILVRSSSPTSPTSPQLKLLSPLEYRQPSPALGTHYEIPPNPLCRRAQRNAAPLMVRSGAVPPQSNAESVSPAVSNRASKYTGLGHGLPTTFRESIISLRIPSSASYRHLSSPCIASVVLQAPRDHLHAEFNFENPQKIVARVWAAASRRFEAVINQNIRNKGGVETKNTKI
ncbi:hypothetical protein R3P38DRAFT_1296884 [Favolaschia claudopus]|uniref:Uncharacterized protein n=1 Tax=Favolaschia claudopus TaxID=2862362 RepID=A0AAW0AYS0_9AGAR